MSEYVDNSGLSRQSKRAKKAAQQKSWWFRYRFFLSGLLILLPLIYAPEYLKVRALSQGSNGLGERMISTQTVGPWEVTLAEAREMPPYLNGTAGYMKAFNLALCQGCDEQIRAAYLRVGKPRSMRTAGAMGFGSPYRMGIHIPIAENTRLDALIWLTLEGWDGEVHRASWPLAEASPATIAWLKKQQISN